MAASKNRFDTARPHPEKKGTAVSGYSINGVPGDVGSAGLRALPEVEEPLADDWLDGGNVSHVVKVIRSASAEALTFANAPELPAFEPLNLQASTMAAAMYAALQSRLPLERIPGAPEQRDEPIGVLATGDDAFSPPETPTPETDDTQEPGADLAREMAWAYRQSGNGWLSPAELGGLTDLVRRLSQGQALILEEARRVDQVLTILSRQLSAVFRLGDFPGSGIPCDPYKLHSRVNALLEKARAQAIRARSSETR